MRIASWHWLFINKFQIKAEQFDKEIDEAERKNTQVCKVLDEVRNGVSKLFKVRSILLLLEDFPLLIRNVMFFTNMALELSYCVFITRVTMRRLTAADNRNLV